MAAASRRDVVVLRMRNSIRHCRLASRQRRYCCGTTGANPHFWILVLWNRGKDIKPTVDHWHLLKNPCQTHSGAACSEGWSAGELFHAHSCSNRSIAPTLHPKSSSPCVAAMSETSCSPVEASPEARRAPEMALPRAGWTAQCEIEAERTLSRNPDVGSKIYARRVVAIVAYRSLLPSSSWQTAQLHRGGQSSCWSGYCVQEWRRVGDQEVVVTACDCSCPAEKT